MNYSDLVKNRQKKAKMIIFEDLRKTAASFVVTWFVKNISATVDYTVAAGHDRCSDKDYFFNQKIDIKSVHSSLS